MNDPSFEDKSMSFADELDDILTVSRVQIKDLCVGIMGDATAERFWRLTRYIRVSSFSDLEFHRDLLFSVIEKHIGSLESAAFAAGHLIRKLGVFDKCFIGDLMTKIRFPACPREMALLMHLISVDGVIFNDLSFLFQIPDLETQKIIVKSIANSNSGNRILLEQTLNSIPIETDLLSVRGKVLLCESLQNIEIPVSKYLKTLIPLISSPFKTHLQASVQDCVQSFISKLLDSCPSAFHNFNMIDIVSILYESRNLLPEFLKAVLKSYGRSYIRSLSKKVLIPALLEINGYSMSIIEQFCIYAIHFDAKTQLALHSALITECEFKKYDKRLLEITVSSIASLAPIVSPFIGRLLYLISNSKNSPYLFGLIRPLLDNKVPPPMQPLSGVIFVPEEDKRYIGTQTFFERIDNGIQFDSLKKESFTQ